MKKVALLLAFFMILTCCLVTTSCDNNSGNSKDTVDKKIQQAIETRMVWELMNINAGRTNENRLYAGQTIITSINALDNNGEKYEVYGKQNFKDVYDTKYVATFSAEVINTDSGYKATIKSFGSLIKE